MREDWVTDGGRRDEILAQRPAHGSRLLRRPQGGRVSDPSLLALTLAEARDGLAGESRFPRASSRPPTTTRSGERAAQCVYHADPRTGAGRWPMRRISGWPAARPCRSTASRSRSRISICTKGVLTTAASHILDGFHPPYESTVTDRLWQSGAVMLGKANLDEFAMGSSSTTSCYGPVENPWRRLARRQPATGSWRLVGGLGGSGGRPRRASPRPAPTPAARSASRRAFAALSA